MNTKSIFASKTFWLNLLGGVITVSGTATDVIPPKYAPGILAAGSIANIILRLITNQGVTLTGTK